jgi:hypothetical protein
MVLLEKTIHHYALYMDIVGSSDSQLDLSQQVSRVKAFNDMVRNILSNQESEYSDSTGDGVVISFNHPSHPFIFSSRLLRDLLHYSLFWDLTQRRKTKAYQG